MFTYFVLFITVTSVLASTPCNYVAFRIDDIQDDWLDNAQQAVIKVFWDQYLPVTIGIIGNSFGEDSTMVDFTKRAIQDTRFDLEIANHGYNHESFPTFSLDDQTELLSEALAKTVNALSPLISESDITTFIPPYNEWNANTLTAAKRNGFNVISADISDYDGASYPVYKNDASLLHFPVGSATTDLSDTYKISAEESFSMIQDQMNSHGFSVVMMHFVEFTKNNALDNSAINDLKRLVQMVQNAGYGIATFKELRTRCAGTSSGSGSAATTGKRPAATTGKPVVATTGKAAAATTGKTPAATTSQTQAPATTAKIPSSTTGNAPAATTGKAPASTTGKAPASTTGKAPASTTGKAPASTTGKATSTTCTLGEARCVGTNGYQSCGWATQTQTGWAAVQYCPSGLKCKQSGTSVYCDY